MTVEDALVRHGTLSMVTATLGVNDPEVGTFKRYGDEEWVFVYNAGNSQITKGCCTTVSAVTGYSVTVSMTDAVDVPVGVCVHATLTTGTYGWLCRKGFVKVLMGANNSVAAGGLLVPSTDGVWLNKTISTGFIVNGCAKAMEAIASNTSGVAYLSIY